MSKARIVTTTQGFEAWGGCPNCGTERYLNRVQAARLIKVHPESLARLYRNAGAEDNPEVGIRVGRDLFFTRQHLARLGYVVPDEVEDTLEDDIEAQAEKAIASADMRVSSNEEALPW